MTIYLNLIIKQHFFFHPLHFAIMSLSLNNQFDIEFEYKFECDSDCGSEYDAPETRSRNLKLPKHAFQAKRIAPGDLSSERKNKKHREQKKKIHLSRSDKRKSKSTFIENSFPFAEAEEDTEDFGQFQDDNADSFWIHDIHECCELCFPRWEQVVEVAEEELFEKVPKDFCSVAKAVRLRKSLTLRDVLGSMGLDHLVSINQAFNMGIYIKKNMPENSERKKIPVYRHNKFMMVLSYPWYELATLEHLVREFVCL